MGKKDNDYKFKNEYKLIIDIINYTQEKRIETTKCLLKKNIPYLKIDLSYEFKYRIKFREVFFMKKNSLTEVVFILDRSGSMSGLEEDTIGGFNSILQKQREEDGDANVTTILFDHEIEMLHKIFYFSNKIFLPQIII